MHSETPHAPLKILSICLFISLIPLSPQYSTPRVDGYDGTEGMAVAEKPPSCLIQIHFPCMLYPPHTFLHPLPNIFILSLSLPRILRVFPHFVSFYLVPIYFLYHPIIMHPLYRTKIFQRISLHPFCDTTPHIIVYLLLNLFVKYGFGVLHSWALSLELSLL